MLYFSPEELIPSALLLTFEKITLASSMTFTVFFLPDAGLRPLRRIFWIEDLCCPESGAACTDVLGVIPLLSLTLLRGMRGMAADSPAAAAGLIAVEATVFHWLASTFTGCFSDDVFVPVLVTVTTLLILNFLTLDELASDRPLSGRLIRLALIGWPGVIVP